MNRSAFLFNPSPRWKKKVIDKLKHQIEHAIPGEKEYFHVDRAQPESTEMHLEAVLKRPFDSLIIVGGDGSLNRAINCLKKKNALNRMVLGILPFGTCNDFVKTLWHQRRLSHKARVELTLDAAAKGSVRELYLAQVNGYAFINNAGFGRSNPAQKRKSAIADLRAMKAVHTRVSHGQEKLDGDYLMMLAANAPYFSSGLHFTRESNPSVNTLDFFFVKNVSKLRLAAKLFLGKRGLSLYRRHDKSILKIRGERLEVHTDSPVWIMADGEIVPSLSRIQNALFEISGKCRFYAEYA